MCRSLISNRESEASSSGSARNASNAVLSEKYSLFCSRTELFTPGECSSSSVRRTCPERSSFWAAAYSVPHSRNLFVTSAARRRTRWKEKHSSIAPRSRAQEYNVKSSMQAFPSPYCPRTSAPNTREFFPSLCPQKAELSADAFSSPSTYTAQYPSLREHTTAI